MNQLLTEYDRKVQNLYEKYKAHCKANGLEVPTVEVFKRGVEQLLAREAAQKLKDELTKRQTQAV